MGFVDMESRHKLNKSALHLPLNEEVLHERKDVCAMKMQETGQKAACFKVRIKGYSKFYRVVYVSGH
jgi:hypothetical protein